ncbi:putative 3-oxoacyl-[acyl-carrier-protein] synthase [Colletotrichum scovillei]|uniref:3-oxoacyl-[acyl-carrier-protein] synthase, mitochondrial n=2 Tax=Colletotrichum scovillei TaxID=1209932 RepID=A0A9P7UD92_9PEZI|nr:putative 3-oxoacyl-[acyl-carrier-protein] synthase [Colletotrichum scovillei]KAG7070460.1 putative 3-oxoacyl-[acyl-carrier-protein] synthase [Colletotrichum scovillei]
MRRVVVTGLGAISPFGVGVRTTWKRLLAGESAITSVAAFEPQNRWKDLTSTVAGVVPSHGSGPDQWRPADWLDATEQRRMSKFAQYAVACADMAMKDAGWNPQSQEDKEATGVCLGSGIGNLEEIYETSLAFNQQGYKKVSPLFVPKILINLAAGHISMKYGLQGPNHSVTTACTTGAHSIGDAMRFIAFGDADVMVAGGTESCIHPLTFAGFGRARSLSTAYNHNPHASCRPFDRDRNGFVVSEGSAVLVLEELEHAKARGANIYAEVRGYGCSGDAHHMTAPREDGHGAFRAMKLALKNAEVRPAEVNYINAHATGTQVGDAAEASAIRSIMTGEEGYADESQVTVSSTKGAVGHLLGAAGAIEALFAVLSVAEDIVPPTLNLENPNVGGSMNMVPLEAQAKQVNVAISNSFGFGGTNASLVFSKHAKRQDRSQVSSLREKHAITFKMACQSCRYQARLLARSLRATADLSPSQQTSIAATARRAAALTTSKTGGPAATTTMGRRHFSQTATRRDAAPSSGGLKQAIASGMMAAAPKTMAATLTTSRLEALYKICSSPALYKISEQERAKDMVRMTAEGEEVGDPIGPWLQFLDLQPGFSSWSQATMLHMYLVLARLRCLDRDSSRNLQHQFIDQFFFDCERMMHLNHGMTSAALRQRYLKEIFVQWRGLIAAYDEGVVKDDKVLGAAVWRNLFKSREDADLRQVAAVVGWMRATLQDLEAAPVEDILVAPAKVFKRDVREMFALVDAVGPQVKGDVAKLGGGQEQAAVKA